MGYISNFHLQVESHLHWRSRVYLRSGGSQSATTGRSSLQWVNFIFELLSQYGYSASYILSLRARRTSSPIGSIGMDAHRRTRSKHLCWNHALIVYIINRLHDTNDVFMTNKKSNSVKPSISSLSCTRQSKIQDLKQEVPNYSVFLYRSLHAKLSQEKLST